MSASLREKEEQLQTALTAAALAAAATAQRHHTPERERRAPQSSSCPSSPSVVRDMSGLEAELRAAQDDALTQRREV